MPGETRTLTSSSTGLVRNASLCKATSHCSHPRCFMQRIFLNPPFEMIAKSCICFWWPKNTNNRHKYTQFSPKTLCQGRLAHGHPSTGLVRNATLCKATSHCSHPRCFMQRYFWTLPLKSSPKVASVFGDPKIQITDTSIHNLAPKHFGRGDSHTDIPQLVSCAMQLCAKRLHIVPTHVALCKEYFWTLPLKSSPKVASVFGDPKIQITDTSIHNLAPKHFDRGDSLTHVCCFPSRGNIFTSCYLTHNSMDIPLLQLTYNIMNTPLWKHRISIFTSCNNVIRIVLNLFEMQLQRTKTNILRFYKTQSSIDIPLCKPFTSNSKICCSYS